MKFIQLTDLHMPDKGEDTRGVDIPSRVEMVLASIKEQDPDRLVVTGDLCFLKGIKEVYKKVKRQLDDLGIPYEVISGNHDKPELIAEVFRYEEEFREGQLYYRREWDGIPAFFLDTTTGRLSGQQLDWYQLALRDVQGPSLLFIHHPPLPIPVYFMEEQHAMKDRIDLQSVIFEHEFPVHTFCGHYHAQFFTQKKNLQLFLTPSCFFQIEPYQKEFSREHTRAGYRIVEYDGDHLSTTVRYV